MSRSNVISIEPDLEGLAIDAGTGAVEGFEGGLPGAIAGAAMDAAGSAILVTFAVHGAEGTRTYRYEGEAAAAILAGSDPAGYEGERVD